MIYKQWASANHRCFFHARFQGGEQMQIPIFDKFLKPETNQETTYWVQPTVFSLAAPAVAKL
jgi:hypothetical protein